MCVSPGPHQYVFTSNSNPNGNAPGTWDITGEIYKMELDGTIIGKFGKPGKSPAGFQVVHMMDCRNPNEIIVGEIESWRVQKFILQPASNSASSAAPRVRSAHMNRIHDTLACARAVRGTVLARDPVARPERRPTIHFDSAPIR